MEIVAATKITYIDIDHHKDERGDLIAFEENNPIPFHPLRTFCLMNVAEGQKRAGHAVDSELFIVALKGSATLVHTDIENTKSNFPLSNDSGIYVPARFFIEIEKFSSDALVMVYASKKFSDTNYFGLDQL